jgi:hypothetical protein
MPAPHRRKNAGERRQRYGDNADRVELDEMVHAPSPIFLELVFRDSADADSALATPWRAPSCGARAKPLNLAQTRQGV